VARAQAPDAVSEAGAARIRAAAIGDASDVARLLEALGYPCDRSDAAERIAVVLGDPRQHLLLAELEGVACGLAALQLDYSLTRGADVARITALVVSPNCQRQGIGRRLLREMESIARGKGAIRIEVTSNPRRLDAHAFYRDCGYPDGSLHFARLLGD
jgi:GNAT superfamily N-acetyltransferase